MVTKDDIIDDVDLFLLEKVQEDLYNKKRNYIKQGNRYLSKYDSYILHHAATLHFILKEYYAKHS